MSKNARGEIKHCESCGSIVSEREISLYRGLVDSLWKVFKWCKENNIHEFETKKVRHLLGQINYARFGDWVMFGGLVYKKEKAHYGLNMERCEEFFKNRYAIPMRVWKNPVTGEIRPEEKHFSRDIPSLVKLLDVDGYYIANYRDNESYS